MSSGTSTPVGTSNSFLPDASVCGTRSSMAASTAGMPGTPDQEVTSAAEAGPYAVRYRRTIAAGSGSTIGRPTQASTYW